MKRLILILIVLGFVLVTACSGPQRIKLSSCLENEGVKTDCRTFEIEGEIDIIPIL
ncbi:hypothetical protein LCGC14_0775690 [marine sediment metagenome]|uniref:Uncharacterized protein n=1 Tax=marine sediment metagenome TaxID=412755 RepID=A0A0F9Q193_9ZZZZ